MFGILFRRVGVLGIVAGLIAVPMVVGCSSSEKDSANSTPVPAYRVTLDTDRVFLNDIVTFSLINVETGEAADNPHWSVASPHNVPGDRGVMRTDGLYTAPRIAPDPQIVKVRARFKKIDYLGEFYVLDPRYPDPNATASPGGSHTIFNIHNIETTRPTERGIRVGESFGVTAADGTGTPLVIDHYEISQNNKVVDNAGTITKDGIYTAPLEVPNPSTVSIDIYYLKEGRAPGSLSMIGVPSFEIVPEE